MNGKAAARAAPVVRRPDTPPPAEVGKVPPSDLDAEAAVLSALLLDGSRLGEINGILEPRHFAAQANARIFETIRQLAAGGRDIDIVTVSGVLRDAGLLVGVGGTTALVQLADATPAIAHVADHARRVVEKWRLRQAQLIGRTMAAEAGSDVGDLGVWLAKQQAALRELDGATSRAVATPESVLTSWATRGALVHEPTGIAKLDELTGGGPVYGTRWYLAGAPDAGKTALLVQFAHTFAERGVAVGLLAVDEEPDDITTRLVQRHGYARHHCEARDPLVLERMLAEIKELPIRLYDASWTIEEAARDLAAGAADRGSRAALFVDSVQTAHCNADRTSERELSEVTAVSARVAAIRQVATDHHLIAIATSELGRSAYRSGDPTQQTSTLASAKWSGAIEYSARVLIGLRSVADQPDLVELELAKNKHGPRDERFHLHIDRRAQTLGQAQYDPPPPATSASRDAVARDGVATDAIEVARILMARPGLGARDLRAAVKAGTGAGHGRTDAAVQYLGLAIVRGTGPRGATPMSINAAALPEAIRRALGLPE